MIPDVNMGRTVPAEANPKDLATKVQGMFMEVMLKAMEDSVDAEDGLFGNSASSDIYRGMLREQIAGAMSAQINSPLEHQLDRALKAGSVDARPEAGTDRLQQEEVGESTLPVSGVVSSPEGWRRDPINGEKRYHAGTDIAAPEGTVIKSMSEGRVIESGLKGSYGNAVVVQSEDGRKMLYAHNRSNLVHVGDWVSRGEPIAEVGSTGRATGPHVHFEVKF